MHENRRCLSTVGEAGQCPLPMFLSPGITKHSDVATENSQRPLKRNILLESKHTSRNSVFELQTWGLTIGPPGLDNSGFKWLPNIHFKSGVLPVI